MPTPAHEPIGPHYSTLPQDRDARLAPGTCVVGGRYEVVEELGRGGMSVVYQAIDRHEGDRKVALKVANVSADRALTTARFQNEARLGASLAAHAHVARPFEVGCLDGPDGFSGRMFLVTELLEGVGGDVVMRNNHNGLPPQRACLIARDVARALVDLHERGIVHRDIKPSNVIVSGSGDDECGRVIDFGLAYATGDGWEEKSPDLTGDGLAPGTVLYMSPQQAAHVRPEPAFDIYSLGVMLYELFSGDPPYHGYADGELLARKCDPEAAPFPIAKMCSGLAPYLATLVDRCMLYEPKERPSAKEVVEVLDRALGDADPGPPVARRRAWVIIPLVMLAATAVAVVWFWPGPQRHAEDLAAPEHSSALASSAYAQVPSPAPTSEGVEAPSPAAASTVPPEPMPSSPQQPVKRTRPPKNPKQPPQPPIVTEPKTDTCPQDIEAAREATRGGQWKRVLRLTRKPKCWAPDALAERTRVRIRALLETKRYQECIELGRGSDDGGIARLVVVCETRQEQGKQ